MVPGENTQLVPFEGPSCANEPEHYFLCIIRDTTSTAKQLKETINFAASTTASQLVKDVAERFCYYPDSFELLFQRKPDGNMVTIDPQNDATLDELGFQCDNARNCLTIVEKGSPPRRMEKPSGDANADSYLNIPPPVPLRDTIYSIYSAHDHDSEPPSYSSYSERRTTNDSEYSFESGNCYLRQETGYVGLVNQAMTCYLNSLLQTLYMTPEFRNALYRWEFDGTEEDGVKSIPFQLQKLFLQLQTSRKPAVGTTELTTSFGWDSSEAWQQHDVQELCRVMFDALELKFKNTDQAQLISCLYEGKLKDYVKCLECGSESAREDTFLDVPLVVRPFGSTQAYGSVEEALKAFVTPETLEGSNQYFCERCNKKCNAHKGLKFTKFPYLLTLQLKRFDFDPATMHRIKLNDKVTFPGILDLNEFIKMESGKENCGEIERLENGPSTVMMMDCSANGIRNMASLNGDLNSDVATDDDEGIDMSPHGAYMPNNEVTTNIKNLQKSTIKGPYVYELFSIMVHSGSANGGHYYAYIKSFKDGQWYCFNDAQVTAITEEDIRKTYGGGPSRGYYSSAYSSSTNAYMLMYRQIDKERNSEPMTVEEFPEHIKQLLQSMQEQEEREKQQRELDRAMCKIKLFCHHPKHRRLLERRLKIHKDSTLAEARNTAYTLMGLEGVVPLDHCRLVKYDELHDSLECSYEDMDDKPIGEILGGVKSSYPFDLLLEIRKPENTFQVYRPGGTTVKVHQVDLERGVVLLSETVRGRLNQTVEEFRQQVAQVFSCPPENLRLVLEKACGACGDVKLLSEMDKTLKSEGFCQSNKVFAEFKDPADAARPFFQSRLYEVLDCYENTICINVTLPRVDKETLERIGIPANSDCNGLPKNSGKQIVDESPDALPIDVPKNRHPIIVQNEAPQECDEGLGDSDCCEPGIGAVGGGGGGGGGSSSYHLNSQAGAHSDQSEDSSLTDSERTLVGELSPRNNSPDLIGTDIDSGLETREERVSDFLGEGDGGIEGCASYDSTSSSLHNEVCDEDRNLSSPEENTREYSAKLPKDAPEDWDGDADNPEQGDTTARPAEVKRHFRAWPYTDPETNEKTLRVYVDKRITLGAVKTELQPWVGVSSDYFKLYRTYSNNQEYECTKMSETMASFSEDSRLIVKLGRALRKGEYRVKIYQLLVNDPEPCQFLIDWIFAQGMTILQAKKEILPEIREKCNLDIPLNRCRLRKKSKKNPGSVYLDTQKLDEDIPIYANWEVYLEILTEAEPVTSLTQQVLFVRWWRPSTYLLDLIREVVLDQLSGEELKSKLSALSGILPEDIEFAKGHGSFPYEISLLSIQTELDWRSDVGKLDLWPINIMDDGCLVYFRDRNETPKILSEAERREITTKESARLSRLGGRVFSPRKEKALKIYTDTTPSSNNSTTSRSSSSSVVNVNSSSITSDYKVPEID